ncbi:C40 family peptidase [Paenibacillus gansuensis]|uniref:C40 family peptidase n=1 Tax=Paenibacillus gansuensis TaxID=306542 RepID=A0ABW5PIR8_9BACL
MRKVSAVLLGLAVSLSVMVGSASAATSLDSEVSKLIGIDYDYGGTTKSGFDCSGFTSYVFNRFDIELPHSSKAQAQLGSKVSKDELRAGDLVFFETGGDGISHVGIYVGDGEFAHASSKKGVTISKMNDSYYVSKFVTARRILSNNAYKQLAVE